MNEPYEWQVSLQLRYVLAWGTAVKLLNAVLIGDPQSAQIIEWLLRKR